MRRIFAAFFVTCILAVVALVAAPWWINSERLRGSITATLEQVSGRSVSFQGDAKVTLSPFFGILLADLVIDNRDGPENRDPLLRAEQALVSINPVSAVFGKIDIQNVELQRPRLTLIKTGDGYSNWHLLAPDSSSTSSAIFADAENPLRIRIQDGAIAYRDEISGTDEAISNLAGELDWPGANRTNFSFRGNAIWRNESVALGLDITDLPALGAGKDSSLTLNFSSEPLVFDFEGTVNLQAGVFANGEIDARSPSISRINDLFDLDLETGNIIGNWAARGRLELKPGSLLLTDASVVANDTPATGVVRLATSELGNSKLDGTLALSDVDLTELATVEFLDTLSTNMNRENLTMDLRLSAEQARIGNLVINDVASTISNGQDGFKIDISDANVSGSMIVGKVSIERHGEQQVLSILADATDINLDALPAIGAQTSLKIDALSKVHLELSTPLPEEGEKFLYSGSVELASESGTLHGLALPLRLNPDDERSMQVERIAGDAGETAFDSIDFKIRVFDNSGFVQNSTLQSGDYTLRMSGILNFASGSLALRGDQIDGSGDPLEQLQIGGTIFEPLITIRRIETERNPDEKTAEDAETSN